MCDGSGARTSSARERVLCDVSVTDFVMSPRNLRAGQAGRTSCGRIRRNALRPRRVNRDQAYSTPIRVLECPCFDELRNGVMSW
jgi:hypothetical protein